MGAVDVIDLSSDDVIRKSNAKGGRNEMGFVFGPPQIMGSDKVGEGKCWNSNEKNGQVNESCLASLPAASCVEPICRQFWRAGNYEVGNRSVSKVPEKDGKNQLLVHPMFLHSNATTHKWVFGAIAELIDNAFDEGVYWQRDKTEQEYHKRQKSIKVRNGATFVYIDKILNPRDKTPALLIQDDGSGMDPEALRHCMSFGFSDKKTKHAIGHYGNGFKTGSIRLGADVIVFSCHQKMRILTQSIALLSYTFLRQMGYGRIVVPMVNYEFNSSSNTYGPILERGKEHFSSNLAMLLKWSPYTTEGELLNQFDDVGNHGTKIVIYNLWLNNDGDMELDFDSDPKDIYINGHPKIYQGDDCRNPGFDHVADRYHYSLRAYLSILYLKLPQCFNIVLRGYIVQHHNIADDLKFMEYIVYKPQTSDNEAVVVTTIGFVKEAPHANIHGYCIYHRNRLILPFWHGRRLATNSCGRGVVGVLQANFIEPTHNKQDFEKTSLFQKLEDRLKQMTEEYWRLHCELIGYLPVGRTKAPLSSAVSWPDSAVRKRKGSAMYQVSCQQGSIMKRKELNPPENDTGHHGEIQPRERFENQVEHSQKMILMRENRRLRSQILDLEKEEKELNMKLQQLQSELQDSQRTHTMLLQESRSLYMY